MNTLRTRGLLSAVLVGVLWLGGTVEAVWAADAKAPEEPAKPTRKVPTISEQVFKKLGEAQEMIDAKNYNGAISGLLNIVDARKYNTNEKGQIHNMLGFAYYSKEDYPNSLKHYKIVAEMGDGVPEGLETTTLYTIAQLSFVAERYQDALKYMQIWISKANNPGYDPYIFMGQVYYTMKDYANATKMIEKGISVARQRGTPMKEQWLALLNYLYYEQENWPKVISTLEELIAYWPKNAYWMRLAGIYGQMGKEKEQLWAMQAAHAGKFLEKSGDYSNLAGLLMQEEIPYKASKIMKEGLDKKIIVKDARTLQSYGQALQIAGDTQPAIKVFEEAAGLSDDGKIYERLANLYLDEDKNEQCITAASRAIQKGGLRNVSGVYTVRGMCQYNKGEYTAATGSFNSCNSEARRINDATHIRICSQWIQFIEKDSERRRILKESGV